MTNLEQLLSDLKDCLSDIRSKADDIESDARDLEREIERYEGRVEGDKACATPSIVRRLHILFENLQLTKRQERDALEILNELQPDSPTIFMI